MPKLLRYEDRQEPVNDGCAITFIGLSLYACCTVTIPPQEIQIVSAGAMIDLVANLGDGVFTSVVGFSYIYLLIVQRCLIVSDRITILNSILPKMFIIMILHPC
jgi:hypothetical protein